MSRSAFSWPHFLLRFLFALILVFATYNPTPYAYVPWLIQSYPDLTWSAVAVIGMILLVGWVIYLRATWHSLGIFGTLLAVGFFASFVWFMHDMGWLDAQDASVFAWLALFILSAILAVGMSWSHIRRRISGQFDVDDTETG